ncbi:endocuticle structural glycoprotein SgAbd-1-like [Macrosteles quadrilineatus]|uniref:endocuticle structural glycoprotein SgAbd-1-like n=1 Tax=Macrosteles quadrilineatus TaxID=74068 RepID=UPI0023E264BB|nr:endocuticle structural glycoprotein SgAbd-1-like [Macrosteles quadrilineatus]
MALAKFIVTLATLNFAATQDFFPNVESPLGGLKLTAERGGPPPGAEFVPISVIELPDEALARRPGGTRPVLGRPPPPPPLRPKPTRRPRPRPPVAPQPLPIPLPSSQSIPQRPQTGSLPNRPPGVIVVTPMTEIRPDLETVVTTKPQPPTTTPNTLDTQPSYYQRFIQNEDGSYYFDYAAPNSVQRLEQGFFKRDDFQGFKILVKSGAYSFISPEGIRFRTDYVADEKGYRPFTDYPRGNERFFLKGADSL